MKRAFLLLLATFPTAALVADEPQPPKPVAAIKTDFSPKGVLTEEEIEIVRQLALKAGLPSVAKIRTYNIHPGSGHIISVTSQEEVLGREYRLTGVDIHYKKEGWEPVLRNPADAAHRIGDFWSSGISPDHRLRGGIYDYKGKQLRVGLEDDIQVAFGDPIVAAFAAGKIKFENPQDRKTAERYQDGEFIPIGIGEAKGKNCRVDIATKDRLATLSFYCVISDDGFLRVIRVSGLIS